MTKYKLSEERRSQSEVTLTGYMIGGNSDNNTRDSNIRISDINSDSNYYVSPVYTNSNMELNVDENVNKNVRSNSCTCSEKGKYNERVGNNLCLF